MNNSGNGNSGGRRDSSPRRAQASNQRIQNPNTNQLNTRRTVRNMNSNNQRPQSNMIRKNNVTRGIRHSRNQNQNFRRLNAPASQNKSFDTQSPSTNDNVDSEKALKTLEAMYKNGQERSFSIFDNLFGTEDRKETSGGKNNSVDFVKEEQKVDKEISGRESHMNQLEEKEELVQALQKECGEKHVDVVTQQNDITKAQQMLLQKATDFEKMLETDEEKEALRDVMKDIENDVNGHDAASKEDHILYLKLAEKMEAVKVESEKLAAKDMHLQTRAEELNSLKSSIDTYKKELEGETDTKREKLRILEESLAQQFAVFAEQKASFEKRLIECEKHERDLEEKRNRYQYDAHVLRQQQVLVVANIEAQQHEIVKLRNKIDEERRVMITLRETNEERIAKKLAVIEQREKEFNSLTCDASELVRARERLELEKSEIHNLQLEIEKDFNEKLTCVESREQELRNSLQEIEDKETLLENVEKQFMDRKHALDAEESALAAEKESLNASKEEFQRQQEDLELQSKNKEAKILELKNDLELREINFEKKVAGEQELVEKLGTEIASKTIQLQRVDEMLKSKSEDTLEQIQQVDMLRKAVDEKWQILRTEQEQWEKQIVTLRQKEENLSGLTVKIQKQSDDILAQRKTLNEKMNELNSRRETMDERHEAQVKQLQEAFSARLSDLEKRESELKTSKRELAEQYSNVEQGKRDVESWKRNLAAEKKRLEKRALELDQKAKELAGIQLKKNVWDMVQANRRKKYSQDKEWIEQQRETLNRRESKLGTEEAQLSTKQAEFEAQLSTKRDELEAQLSTKKAEFEAQLSTKQADLLARETNLKNRENAVNARELRVRLEQRKNSGFHNPVSRRQGNPGSRKQYRIAPDSANMKNIQAFKELADELKRRKKTLRVAERAILHNRKTLLKDQAKRQSQWKNLNGSKSSKKLPLKELKKKKARLRREVLLGVQRKREEQQANLRKEKNDRLRKMRELRGRLEGIKAKKTNVLEKATSRNQSSKVHSLLKELKQALAEVEKLEQEAKEEARLVADAKRKQSKTRKPKHKRYRDQQHQTLRNRIDMRRGRERRFQRVNSQARKPTQQPRAQNIGKFNPSEHANRVPKHYACQPLPAGTPLHYKAQRMAQMQMNTNNIRSGIRSSQQRPQNGSPRTQVSRRQSAPQVKRNAMKFNQNNTQVRKQAVKAPLNQNTTQVRKQAVKAPLNQNTTQVRKQPVKAPTKVENIVRKTEVKAPTNVETIVSKKEVKAPTKVETNVSKKEVTAPTKVKKVVKKKEVKTIKNEEKVVEHELQSSKNQDDDINKLANIIDSTQLNAKEKFKQLQKILKVNEKFQDEQELDFITAQIEALKKKSSTLNAQISSLKEERLRFINAEHPRLTASRQKTTEEQIKSSFDDVESTTDHVKLDPLPLNPSELAPQSVVPNLTSFPPRANPPSVQPSRSAPCGCDPPIPPCGCTPETSRVSLGFQANAQLMGRGPNVAFGFNRPCNAPCNQKFAVGPPPSIMNGRQVPLQRGCPRSNPGIAMGFQAHGPGGRGIRLGFQTPQVRLPIPSIRGNKSKDYQTWRENLADRKASDCMSNDIPKNKCDEQEVTVPSLCSGWGF